MSMIHFADADKHLRFMCLNVCLAQCLNRFLFVKVLEVTSNKEKAIVSIVKFTFATSSGQAALIVLQKVPSEFYPKVCNHGEGPY